MNKVLSRDGTTIAFDRSGEGSPVILVSGALGNRSHPMFRQLAAELAPHFTVFNYDRRGRGESGDTAPYALEREIRRYRRRHSRGRWVGVRVRHFLRCGPSLEAAARLTGITKLALYEPPLIVDDSWPPLPEDYVAQLSALISAGRRNDAAEPAGKVAEALVPN